jgi:NAD(P)-dependent dehydrogenase (short-subunit alcohol dehydrogenase family)
VGSTGWAEAETIDDVLERMDAIEAALPATDGIATFNRMYRQVTRLVDLAVDHGLFVAGPFLGRLDVLFANIYFEAYAADQDHRPIPQAWAPLFEARTKPHTHPIQFALAGMNAHICHDLPSAVVATCRELAVRPEDDSPEHQDFATINSVLADAEGEIKSWFCSGIVATVDELAGKLDDGFAMFGIATARAGAWEVSQLLWDLMDHERLDRLFRANLGRTVAMTSRGILL